MDEYRIQIKTEPGTLEIEKEDIASEDSDDECKRILDTASNPLAAYSSNYNNIIRLVKTESRTKYTEENCMSTKTEYDSSDDLSDHFEETCIKSEKLTERHLEKYDNETDTALFNRGYREENIKEDISDIEIEDHKIKLDADENIPQNNHKQETSGNTEKNNVYFKCNFCSYKTLLKSSFKKHVSLHEDPNKVSFYFCIKCNYRTRQKCHLKRHDLVHQDTCEITMFHCYICNFKTKQKCSLNRHINSIHRNQPRDTKTANENEIFSCSECSYTTIKKGLLISHLDKHKDTRDLTHLYICDICSLTTKYRKNLRMHLDTHKGMQELQTYECKICNFKTKKRYCLKRHFLSRKHLRVVGKPKEYRPRPQKL